MILSWLTMVNAITRMIGGETIYDSDQTRCFRDQQQQHP